MSNLTNSIYSMQLIDELAQKKTFVHRIHPLIKLLVTVFYLITVVSFGRHEIEGLIPFFLYPLLIFIFAEIPVMLVLKRVLVVEPLIIGIGILNPLIDKHLVVLADVTFSRGWITFCSILLKGGLTITASILLISTTSMFSLAACLRILKVPKIFVLQLLLTYRYISVLIEEVSRMVRAYFLRTPNYKGLQPRHWGSFAGLLIIRTYERAQRVYESMSLRGFAGEYNTSDNINIGIIDGIYFFSWIVFFIIARRYNISALIGSLFTGVF